MTDENIRVLKVAPGKAPEAVAIPNTLAADFCLFWLVCYLLARTRIVKGA